MKFIFNRVVLVIILLAFFFQVNGQKGENKRVANLKAFDEKPIHFGFLIGLNTMNFNIQHSGAATMENGGNPRYAEILNLQPGINLGIVTSFRLRKNINLRVLPGISFGQRDFSFIDSNGVKEDEPLQIKTTFLELPIMIKYGADRNHNFKPYLIAGINTRYDLAKKKQSGLLLKGLDFYYEIGAGFDSYLNYFRLSTELKISLGVRDMLDHNGTGELLDMHYTQAIDKLTSRIFVLSFYFE